MSERCLVGYTYRGYEMAYAFARARKFGYDAVELRDFADADLSGPAQVARTLERAAALAREHGLAIHSVFYGPLPISRENERAEEENAFCEVIAHLSAHRVPVLHTRLSVRAPGGGEIESASKAGDAEYEAVRDTLARITPMAEIHHVRIAIEAHMGTMHDTAASLLKIVEEAASPTLTASLDFANLLIAEPHLALEEVPERFGAHIGYVHLKNVKLLPGGFDWNLPLRYGDVNYYRVLRALRRAGYAGPLAVEYCGSGDPDVIAAEDAAYLLDLVKRTGG